MSNLSEKDTPNVVICTCDQLRAFELGCYGHEVLQTPNIDRLAKDGTRFEQAVTNCPSCTPARSSLLSGQYSRTCTGTLQNVPLNSRLEEIRIRFRGKTLPEVLQDQGYDTVLCGKWHIHAEPEVLGFNRVLSAATEELRIKAIEEYICNHKGGPFFLYHNIVSPHMPLFETVPERYTDLYTRDEVQLRGNVWRNGKLPHDEWWFRVYLYKDFFRDYHLNNGKIDMQRYSLPKDFDIYDLTALYYGSVIRLDNLVGQLMYILEKNGIAERTIVVFVSDHGDCLHQI
jgi:arylsulfatase A-like enzyme